MLTVAEVSALIAAAVMIVQYTTPIALVLILVKYTGTESNAATWSVINRIIANTLWPHFLGADSVSTRFTSRLTNVLGWTGTILAALLVLASTLTPLGIRDEVIPSKLDLVQFQHAPDTSVWSIVTMPRPDMPFTRICESGKNINCPGQYQGVYMNETSPGNFSSVGTDENSTINTTIPANFTAMFYSATSNPGNTLSGLFDIQYRRWKYDKNEIYDKGHIHTVGDASVVEILIPQNSVILKDGLIVDMGDNPGLGFRNHTVPLGLHHGGTWSEDLTWVDPVTKCADTNLTIEYKEIKSQDSFTSQTNISLIDRGAFQQLDITALESKPWLDNQTLDLFGRAYKAARMYNVLVATELNISLPLKTPDKTLPPLYLGSDEFSFELPTLVNPLDAPYLSIGQLAGVGKSSGNSSINYTHDYIPYYPDRTVKLLALNYTAITEICRGYYAISDIDGRSNNITYPAVDCGLVMGVATGSEQGDLSPSAYTGVRTMKRNIYVCATGVKASIKTVDFQYNSSTTQLSALKVTNISDKSYPNEQSKPLWAVEASYDFRMRFDGMWGLVNDSYENYTGFYTARAEHLWLPTSPSLWLNFGELEGYDTLAAVSTFNKHIGNLYGGLSDLGGPDYSGKNQYGLLERYRELSTDNNSIAKIPSLILADGLAGELVGTKSAYSDRGAPWPAMLSADNVSVGYPQTRVLVYKRAIRYDLRYAVPALAILCMFVLIMLWMTVILITTRSLVTSLRNIYNQTSTGRLATLLIADHPTNPAMSTSEWVKSDGRRVLSFGQTHMPEQEKSNDTWGSEKENHKVEVN